MSNRIRRHHQSHSGVAVTTSVNTTDEIDLTAVAGGCVIVPAGAVISALAYYGAREPGAAFVAIQDSSGSPVTQSVSAGSGYPLPDACFGYGALKLVADAAGSVGLSLKG